MHPIYRTDVPVLPRVRFFIFIQQIYLIIFLDFLSPSSFIPPQHVLYFLMLPFLVAVRKADNLLPSCAVVTKSGSINFLEPFGPVQACNGTALHLPLPFLVHKIFTFYINDVLN